MKQLFILLIPFLTLFATSFESRIYQDGWSMARDSGLVEMTILADSISNSERKPIEVIFAIDISKDSRNSSLQEFIKGAYSLVDNLKDGDYFGVITYSEYARTLIPLTSLDSKNREDLKGQLSGIGNEKGRSYSSLFNKVSDEFSVYEGGGSIDRVLIMTTTGAEKKETKLEHILNKIESKYRVVTIGIGNGFNAELMLDLAEKSLGNGYYIEPDSSNKVVITIDNIAKIISNPAIISPSISTNISNYKCPVIPVGGVYRKRLHLSNNTDKENPLESEFKYINVKDESEESILSTLHLNPADSIVEYVANDWSLVYYEVLRNLVKSSNELLLGDEKFRKDFAEKYNTIVLSRIDRLTLQYSDSNFKDITVSLYKYYEMLIGVESTKTIVRQAEYELFQSRFR